MQLQYSTESVEIQRRFDYWRDVVCKHLIPGDSWSLDERAFDGELCVTPLGAVSIGVMSSPKHHWRREMHHVRQGPDDDLWLGYMAGGDGHVSQEGRAAYVQEGGLVLYDSARSFDFVLNPSRMYCVRLPRSSVTKLVPGIEKLSATVIDSRRPGVQALKAMVCEATTADFQDEESVQRYGAALIEVLAISLKVNDESMRTLRCGDLFSRIQAYIYENFNDPDLSLPSIARAHHVSERTVTRVFALHSQTPMKVVRAARLAASHRALAEGSTRSVTAAALDCGFADLSHFSRVFRSAYGCTPQSVLNEALSARVERFR